MLNNAGTTADSNPITSSKKLKHQSIAGTLSGKFQTYFC
jgi:hypothetical protein